MTIEERANLLGSLSMYLAYKNDKPLGVKKRILDSAIKLYVNGDQYSSQFWSNEKPKYEQLATRLLEIAKNKGWDSFFKNPDDWQNAEYIQKLFTLRQAVYIFLSLFDTTASIDEKNGRVTRKVEVCFETESCYSNKTKFTNPSQIIDGSYIPINFHEESLRHKIFIHRSAIDRKEWFDIGLGNIVYRKVKFRESMRTLLEELMHSYQSAMSFRYSNNQLSVPIPVCQQQEYFLYNQRIYVELSAHTFEQYACITDRCAAYEAQPIEKHAKAFADYINKQLFN